MIPLTRALNVIKENALNDVPSIPAAPQPESPLKRFTNHCGSIVLFRIPKFMTAKNADIRHNKDGLLREIPGTLLRSGLTLLEGYDLGSYHLANAIAYQDTTTFQAAARNIGNAFLPRISATKTRTMWGDAAKSN